MAVANHTIRWTHRLNGENPSSPAGQNNGSWDTVVSGTATSDGYWRVSGSGYNKIISTSSSYQTAVITMKYNTTPVDGTLLASLDSGSYEIKVVSTGTNTSLRIEGSGASSQTISNLDLTSPFMFRLTLDNATGRFYPFDLVESEIGETLYKEITATGTSTVDVSFGCDDGIVDFGNFYFTSEGAYNSDEFSPSIWTSNFLQESGLRVVELLKDSKRIHLKTMVNDSSIVYAHDVSPAVIARYNPPTIFVVIPRIQSSIESLGGGTVIHEYTLEVYVLVKSSDYKYAHRVCAEIAGEVIEEVYSYAGQNDNKDSIVGLSSQIDMKMDEEEVVCINSHTFTMKRRMNYRER